MRKSGIALIFLLLLSIGGCGKENENVTDEPRWETVDEGSAEASAEEEAPAADTEEEAGLAPGLIEEQSFETDLDGWGEVFFVSATPSQDSESPCFMLLKDKKVVYTFPEAPGNQEERFVQVSAVAFQDYNKDGKKDVIVLVTYSNGGESRNRAEIFLQENSDNMFWLDHPELKDYRVEGQAGEGGSFYRDTFLEEYLENRGLTDSVAGLAESWGDYVDYADGLSGFFGTEQQIALFAKGRDIWTETMDYANDIHRFTVAGLGYDGKLTLMVSN